MEPFGHNTSLPPRKRLLSGLKTVNSSCDFVLPIPISSGTLNARLRDVISSAASSPEEIIKEAKLVALMAAEAATAARAAATEKAVVAAKARVAAKSALELLISISRNEASQKGSSRIKATSRKKHVPIKLLYKTNRPMKK